MGHAIRNGLYFSALVTAGALVSAGYRMVENAPAGNLTPGVIDLGMVLQNQSAKGQIPLSNEQEHEVTIEKIASSCGCTVVEPPSKRVGAGETVSLPVAFSGSALPGPVSSDVHVTLSDGSVHSFTITLYVIGENLGVVDFGNVLRHAQDNKRVFDLPWPPGLSLDLASIEYDKNLLQVTATKDAKQRVTQFQISLSPDLPYGGIQGKIALAFSTPSFPPAAIMVSGTVIEPLEVSTYSLAAGLLPRNGRQALSFSVSSPYGHPVHITALEVLQGRCDELHARPVKDSEQEITFALLPPVDVEALVASALVRVHAETPEFSRTFDVEATALIVDGET